MPRAQGEGKRLWTPDSPILLNDDVAKQCDRHIPCRACLARGLEAECSYLTTAEDRAHINMAEIIERLRREVDDLRDRHTQPAREPSEGSRSAGQPYSFGESGYAHYAHSHAGGEGAESGSLPGSSPSSSMTNSRTVTSPDSTGSDSGVTGFPQHAYSVPTHPHVAELDGSVMMPEAPPFCCEYFGDDRGPERPC